MIFKEKNKVIYTKDDYHKKFDNDDWYHNNNKWYYKGYLLHREDGPAIEWSDRLEFWYFNGKLCGKNEYWEIMNIKKKMEILNEI